MTTITEDYVSYETARLLKEKGFDVPCLAHWFIGNEAHEKFSDYPFNWNEVKSDLDWLSRPTQQMAMKWLREVHKLHIWVDYSSFDFNDKLPYLWNIRETKIEGTYWGGTYHKSCEQACEEAIRYCLENLI